jgi:hypothetical protein
MDVSIKVNILNIIFYWLTVMINQKNGSNFKWDYMGSSEAKISSNLKELHCLGFTQVVGFLQHGLQCYTTLGTTLMVDSTTIWMKLTIQRWHNNNTTHHTSTSISMHCPNVLHTAKSSLIVDHAFFLKKKISFHLIMEKLFTCNLRAQSSGTTCTRAF